MVLLPPPSGLPVETREDDPDVQLNYMIYLEEWSGSESSWYLNVKFFNEEANLRTFLATQVRLCFPVELCYRQIRPLQKGAPEPVC